LGLFEELVGPKLEADIEQIVEAASKAILAHVYDTTSESSLQLGLELVLRGLGFRSEFSLGAPGRLDFFHDSGVAIEAKVGGGLNDLRRQVDRYLADPRIRHVIIATAKAHHAGAARDRVSVILVGGGF
jgi:hypothetical protein